MSNIIRVRATRPVWDPDNPTGERAEFRATHYRIEITQLGYAIHSITKPDLVATVIHWGNVDCSSLMTTEKPTPEPVDAVVADITKVGRRGR